MMIARLIVKAALIGIRLLSFDLANPSRIYPFDPQNIKKKGRCRREHIKGARWRACRQGRVRQCVTAASKMDIGTCRARTPFGVTGFECFYGQDADNPLFVLAVVTEAGQ